MRVLSDKSFKEKARGTDDNQDLTNVVTRKQYACDEVKAINEEERQIDFIISTEDPDRMNDVIRVKGWELEAFEKNPVVLFAHDNSEPPVAKAISTKVRPRKKQLTARAQFVPGDVSPFAESLFQLYNRGFMRATSVGFRPLEFTFSDEEGREGGIDFDRAELLEFSLVPVPANPEALVNARKKGIDMQPVVTWAERVLDDWTEYKSSGLHVPRRMVEHLYKQGKPSGKTYNIPIADQLAILRQNVTLVEDQLRGNSKEEDNNMSTKDMKGAISWKRAHPDGTPKADKDETWDGPGEVAELPNEVEDNIDLYERVFAFHEGDEPPTTKGGWKLPHHKADGDNAVVWNAVANAAARLPQTDMPEEEVPDVQDHLGRHYEEFDETPPWEDEKLLPLWQAYQRASKDVEEDESSFDQAKSLCRQIFGDEVTKDVFSDERRKELFDGDEETKENDDTKPNDSVEDNDSAKNNEGKSPKAQIKIDTEEIMARVKDQVEDLRDEIEEEYRKELEEEKAKIAREMENEGLFEIASRFLSALDNAIEKGSIPEPKRREKRILRDVVESLNELFEKLGDENYVTSTDDSSDDEKSRETKSSVDDEDEIDLTEDEVTEILDENTSQERLSEIISGVVRREINHITGKVE